MSKKIEEEIREAEIKTDEISKEIDINEMNTEANTINNIKIEIYKKEYTIEELIKIADKKNKTLDEIEVSKKFKLLMRNYYDGIMWAILKPCCGKHYAIQDLKKKLREADSYSIIDMRCSRPDVRFNKETVDTVIKLIEKYELI